MGLSSTQPRLHRPSRIAKFRCGWLQVLHSSATTREIHGFRSGSSLGAEEHFIQIACPRSPMPSSSNGSDMDTSTISFRLSQTKSIELSCIFPQAGLVRVMGPLEVLEAAFSTFIATVPLC